MCPCFKHLITLLYLYMDIFKNTRLVFLYCLIISFSSGCQSDQAKKQTESGTPESVSPSINTQDTIPKIKQSTPTSPKIPLGLSAKFDIEYQGAFRALAKGESDSNYAIGTIAYNPDNNSIFMAGHDHQKAIAEFAVPDRLSFDRKVANIVKAKTIQSYVRALDKNEVGKRNNRITGMLYYKQHLLVNSEIWYDASGKNIDNLQVISNANDLKNSAFKGMLQLEGAAKVAGYMSAIPKEWQRELGGKYISGWASNYSITSRYSQGPSLFVFDPEHAVKANLTGDRKIATTAKMVFPLKDGKSMISGSHKYRDDVSPIWSALANARYGFIVPNSTTFMVVGYNGGIHSGIGYKIVQDTGRLCAGGCSKIAKDRYNYFWLFDVNDIINAPEPHKIMPYSYGKWSHPYDKGGSHKVIGGTFDSVNNRLLLTLGGAGRVKQYDRPPLILSYKIKAK